MSGGAGVLLEGVVRGGAVLLLALAFARVRSVSAGTRHVALAAVLAWVIVLPLQVAIGPEWRLTVLPPEPIDARPSEDAPVTLASSRAPSVAVSPPERGVVTGPSSKAPSVAARAEGLASREGAAARSRGGPPRGADVDDRSLRARIVDLVLPVYLGGVALLLLLRVVGMLRIRGIRSRSRAASERIERAAVLAADRLRVPVVRPRISDECSLPFVAGLLRPGIVLPSSAAGWPPERLEAVLLHELAHVQRRDPLTALILDLGCAVGWPIPFAWIAARRARSLAEQACDEAVIRAGITRERYADALVELARRARGARLLTAAPGMAAESDLAERVEVLLTGSASSRPSRTLAAACGVAALVVGVLAGACVPTRGASGFDGTPAGTSNVSDGGADLSTNAAGLQTRWSEDGRHAGVFVTGDVDIGRVLAGEADASAGQSVVAMSEDASGRIRAFAWPGDAIEQAPWARRTLAIAARRISDVDFGTGPPRSDAAGGGGQGGVVVGPAAPDAHATDERADTAAAPAPRPDSLPPRERLSGSTLVGTGPSVSRDSGAGVIQAGWIDDGRRTGVFTRGDWSIRGGRLDSPDRDAWIVLFTVDPRDGGLRRLRAWRSDRGIEIDHRMNGRPRRLDDATLRWAEQVLSTLARIRSR